MESLKEMLEAEFDDMGDLLDERLPSPELLEFYRRIRDREIVWNEEIGDDLISVPLYIFKWNKEDKDIPIDERKPIKIFINSDGGTVNSTLFTANVIALSETPVWTIAMGRAYSAGGLLLMAGHTRYIFETTTILIHDGSSGAFGDTGKVVDNLEFTKALEKRTIDFITKHTSISKSLLEKNYRRDWFIFSDEAIKYGIADKIVDNIYEIL